MDQPQTPEIKENSKSLLNVTMTDTGIISPESVVTGSTIGEWMPNPFENINK